MACLARLVASFVLLISFVYMPGSTQRSQENLTWPQKFKIGLLAPWNGSFDDFSALTSASAVSIAIETVHNDPTLGNRIELSVVTRDSGCLSKVAAGNAVELFIDEAVDVFIGPPCSLACRPAAELASYWNKPIVSWVATDPDFNDKGIYTTLGRTLGPFDKMGTFIVEVFKQYNWKRVVLVASNYFLWMDAGKAIRKVFIERNITIAYQTEFERFPPDHYIERVLRKTMEEGRIVVLVVPKEDRRRFLLMAHDLGMTKGEYVFYTIEMLPEENVLNPEDVWAGNDGRDGIARQAFEAVFHVTLAAISNENANIFRKEVARRMRMPPWNDYINKFVDMLQFANGDKYSPFLHDAVLLYAIALNETFNRNDDFRSGKDVAKNIRGKSFRGITGNLVLDNNGDREPDYWISDMVENGSFIKIAEVVNKELSRVFAVPTDFRTSLRQPRWPGGKVGHEYAPPDTPECGFRNELCAAEGVASWIVALSIVLAVAAILTGIGVGIFFYRRKNFEDDLLMQSWKVKWEDIEMLRAGASTTSRTFKGGSTPTLCSGHHSASGNSDQKSITNSKLGQKAALGSAGDPSKSSQSRSQPSMGTQGQGQIFSDIGLYKGVLVAIKHIKKDHMTLTRQVMLEFNEMKNVVHENLCVFVGSCIEPPNICLVWHYCPKGSLPDVLENDAYKIDNMFKYSFMTDLSKGMLFLHCSHIKSHGNLKSSNCLIDARWAVKVTDYGLPSFLAGQNQDEDEQFKRKQWTAPEIMRENTPPPRGTQKGDVYSFAIICFEIMMRAEPYCLDNCTARDVCNRVRNGESIPFRPVLPETTELGRSVIDMIKSAWAEDIEKRPNFMQIKAILRKLTKGEINIMDNVLKMMEKYATNLEDIVNDRTQLVIEEKKKTDRLLYRMLPSTVAEQLKLGKFVQPENYDNATIYFSDIVGFTTIAADSKPLEIVDFLNDLYSCFDDIISQHDVYKVETIGDAYMVVSGVPIQNGPRHSAEIANCALDLLSAVTHFRIRHRPHQQLKLRIGLHTGPVVAGVVGNVMPRYCLFGDTVNMATKMESNGLPLRIHISRLTYVALCDSADGYKMQCRGQINIKGRGLQKTYWLYGKKGYDKPLPAIDKDEQAPGGEKENNGKQAQRKESFDMPTPTPDSKSGMPEVV